MNSPLQWFVFSVSFWWNNWKLCHLFEVKCQVVYSRAMFRIIWVYFDCRWLILYLHLKVCWEFIWSLCLIHILNVHPKLKRKIIFSFLFQDHPQLFLSFLSQEWNLIHLSILPSLESSRILFTEIHGRELLLYKDYFILLFNKVEFQVFKQ